MAEGGETLLYVNADIDAAALYRLDPDTGSVLSVESTGLDAAQVAGLSYDFGPAGAQTIFTQDFESGLAASESLLGTFTVNDVNSVLSNGTQMVGHAGNYDNDEYSFYELTVDLTGMTAARIQFDYAAFMEDHFDRVNVLAGPGSIDPPAGLLVPVSGLRYEDLGDVHRPELGQVAYDSHRQLRARGRRLRPDAPRGRAGDRARSVRIRLAVRFSRRRHRQPFRER